MTKKQTGTGGRRADLLTAARELFGRLGYDRTTVEAVIDRSGTSKGTFYHYFKSKEALLDAVIEEMTDQAKALIGSQVEAATGSAIDRLNVYLRATQAWRLANRDLVRDLARVLYRDENAVIQRKSLNRKLAVGGPPLAELIAAGNEEGSFRVDLPTEAAEIIIRLGEAVMERTAALHPDQAVDPAGLVRRINAYFTFIERILAAPEGCLDRLDPSALAELLGLTGE